MTDKRLSVKHYRMAQIESLDNRQYTTITGQNLDLAFKKHHKALERHPEGTNARFEGHDLRDIPLNDYRLEGVQFRRCNLRGFVFRGVSLKDTRFEECDLREALFDNVELRNTNFEHNTWLDGSTITSDNLHSISFQRSHIHKLAFRNCTFGESSGLHFLGCDARRIFAEGLIITNFTINNGSMIESEFPNLRADNVEFQENLRLYKVSFDNARLHTLIATSIVAQDCFFRLMKLSGMANWATSRLIGCDFSYTDFHEWSMQNLYIDDSIFTGCENLHGRHAPEVVTIRGAEKAHYSHELDKCSWGLVRVLGSLPLFGASYFGIIAITTWAFLVKWYNAQVATFKDHHPSLEALQWARHLKPMPEPRDMGLMLIALLFLAVGSTIYLIACPDEVKEYTENQWTNELRRERFVYRVHAFRRCKARWISGILIGVGGLWVGFHLLVRVMRAAAFLLGLS